MRLPLTAFHTRTVPSPLPDGVQVIEAEDYQAGNATKHPWQGPWGWNFCNPQDPLPVDQPLPQGAPYR